MEPIKVLEITKLAKPLIKWLNDNVQPYHTIIVTPNGFALLEGVASVSVTEFVKD